MSQAKRKVASHGMSRPGVLAPVSSFMGQEAEQGVLYTTSGFTQKRTITPFEET